MNEHPPLKRILIIRLSAIGDVLLTTPLIRILRNRLPETEIDFLVKKKYESLLLNNPHLDRVLTFATEEGFHEIRRLCHQIRLARYDCIIDLQMNFRSRLFRYFSSGSRSLRYRLGRWNRFLLVHLRRFIDEDFEPIPLRYLESVSSLGIEDDGLGLELGVEEEAKKFITLDLEKKGIGDEEKIIVLVPGAGRWTKRWPAVKFANVGNHFVRKGYPVFLVGGDEDRAVCLNVQNNMDSPHWNFTGQHTLQETTALLNRAALLITNDTGVMHMGAALGKHIVAIFGPTTRHLGFIPFRTSSIVIERPLSCRPCSFHGTENCPKGHFQCMKQIHSSDVIRAAETLLNEE